MPELMRHIESFRGGDELCYLLLPGSSGGLHHPLMKLLVGALSREHKSVAIVEYPYQTKGHNSPRPNLSDELQAVKKYICYLRDEQKFSRIICIGKSLGGIIATKLMEDEGVERVVEKVHIMGCVIDDDPKKGVDFEHARDKIGVIVQGELDEFGSPEEVRKAAEASGCNPVVIGIPEADHSYRHYGSRELPTHEGEAVATLMEHLML